MFSYNEYRNIINLIRNHLPIIDFSEVQTVNKDFKLATISFVC